MVVIDCLGKNTREINQEIRAALDAGAAEIHLTNPQARHNLAVGLRRPCRMVIEGSVGNYCAGLATVADLEIRGNAGWGVAENLVSGRVVVHGNAGTAVGASLRGGTVVVAGDAGTRTGNLMKGGTIIVGGDLAASSAFMMQKGTLIVCGNAGYALGDSMYQGRIFLGGECPEYGSDVVEMPVADEELTEIHDLLLGYGIPAPRRLRKLVSGKRLWNFSTRERSLWRTAL